MDVGGTFEFSIFNPNLFEVLPTLSFTVSQFELVTPEEAVKGQEYQRVVIALRPFMAIDSRDIPKSIAYEGLLLISTELEILGDFTIPMSGVLIDVFLFNNRFKMK